MRGPRFASGTSLWEAGLSHRKSPTEKQLLIYHGIWAPDQQGREYVLCTTVYRKERVKVFFLHTVQGIWRLLDEQNRESADSCSAPYQAPVLV